MKKPIKVEAPALTPFERREQRHRLLAGPIRRPEGDEWLRKAARFDDGFRADWEARQRNKQGR